MSEAGASAAAVAGKPGWTRALDPVNRVSEVLFGLIMVLTFTGSLSVATDGRAEVRAMLIGALGCNLAWGVIDAILYLLGCLADKGKSLKTLRAVREAKEPAEARRLIAEAVPEAVASVLEPPQLDAVRQRLLELPVPEGPARLDRDDWRGALAVLLLVFLSTLPVVVPFVFIHETQRALRFSNAVAIAMLFLCGWSAGRLTGYHPWKTGLAMVVLGSALAAMTMALGG